MSRSLRVHVLAADIAAARGGDRAALNRVFSTMEPLCQVFVARRARRLPPTMSVADAVQECRLGVMDAVRKFVPGRGGFEAYALLWMSARFGRTSKIERAGAAPRAHDGSGKLRVMGVVSLESSDEDELAPADTLVADIEPADEVLRRHEWRREALRLTERLAPQARTIMRHRIRGALLKEVGAALGVSASRVQRVETEAVRQLRAMAQQEAA